MKFDIIYADPPWKYNDRRLTRNDGKTLRSKGIGACTEYDLLDDADLVSLPISEIAKDDSMLIMWATFPRLDFAINTMKLWGFKYINCFANWIKLNRKQDTPFFGVGFYTRSSSEIALLGKKGKGIKPVSHSVSQILQSDGYLNLENKIKEVNNSFEELNENICPRLREIYKPVIDVCKKQLNQIVNDVEKHICDETNLVFQRRTKHSEKPKEVRKMITDLFGENKSCVELFARADKKLEDNWWQVGNEVQETLGLDIREAIKQIKNDEYIKDMVKYEKN